jgi:hypothetical protein
MNLNALLEKYNASPELSADILSLIQEIRTEANAALDEAHQKVERLESAFKQSQFTNELLTFELARLKRLRFGRTSESLSGAQADLFSDALDEDIGELTARIEESQEDNTAEKVRKPRSRAGRQPIPDHLPRVVIRHDLADCSCGQCGHLMVTIGEDVTEKLVVIPIQFKVEQHIRPKYACRRCDTVTAARVAPSIIEGGMATPSVLTWVLISKYTNHLPLYRIAQIAEREGVILARSTLGDWVGRAGLELSPLYDRLKEMLLSGNVLHVDETPIKQLDPGNKKTHKSYLWGYRNNDLDEGPPIVLFDYQAGRAGAHARNFLGNWRGFLCVDDFVGYKALFTSEDPHEVTCIEVGCLAHARRKFFDLFAVNQSPMAAEALDRIGKIYDTERAAIGLSPEDRQVFRVEKTLPLLKDLKRFLKDSLTKAPPNGAAAKAINYSLKRWEALERFAHTGNLPIDNNPLERDIRPIAIGKRNWLFVGSERAGKRAAVIQSLLGTARLNGINPNEWLENVLENLPVWPNKQLDELLPIQGWKPVSANV